MASKSDCAAFTPRRPAPLDRCRLAESPGVHHTRKVRCLSVLVSLFFVAWQAFAADRADEHLQRGNVLAQKQDWSGAAVEYREALRLRPRYPEAHYNLANALEVRGDRAGAVTA